MSSVNFGISRPQSTVFAFVENHKKGVILFLFLFKTISNCFYYLSLILPADESEVEYKFFTIA